MLGFNHLGTPTQRRPSDMTASLIMESHPIVLHPTDTIGTAARHIMSHRYRSLPVVDDNECYLGQLTVNCMLYLVLPKAATMTKGLDSMPYVNTTLEDLRDRLHKVIDQPVTLCLKDKEKVQVIHPDTPLVETLLTLYQTRASLPVVDRITGRLEGMVSYFDVGAKIMEKGF